MLSHKLLWVKGNLHYDKKTTERNVYTKIVRTFPMKAFVSEINEFQKRLFWFSYFPGAAILNNWRVVVALFQAKSNANLNPYLIVGN